MRWYRALLDRGSRVLTIGFLLLGAAAAVLASQAGVDMAMHTLLDQDDPELIRYYADRRRWGSDEYVIFGLTRSDWFTADSIAQLKEFQGRIDSIPHVRRKTSILDVPLFRSRAVDLPIPLKLGDMAVQLDKARRELLEHTQAVDNLISRDGRDVTILVTFDAPRELDVLDARRERLDPKDPEWIALQPRYDAALAESKRRRLEMVDACRRLARECESRFDEPIRLSGLPIINVNLIEHTAGDLKLFGLLSAVVFALMFLAIYRRLRWVVLPMIACMLPTLIALGILALAGEPITAITSNLPILLFVLTLPYSVYLIERTRELGSIAESAQKIWTPCLYSATTTMAGLASLMTSGVLPVKQFGLMGTIGMAISLAAIFLFFAAALRLLRPLPTLESAPREPLRPLAKLCLGAPGLVVALSAVLLGLAAWGTSRVTSEAKFINYFRSESEVYRGLEIIDTRIGGTTPLEVILEGPPGHFKTEEGLKQLDEVAEFFRTVPETGSVRSMKSLADEIRKSFPRAKDAELVRLMNDVAPDLRRDFTTDDFSVSRVQVRMKETAPTLNRRAILERLEEHLRRPTLASLRERRITGVFLLYSNLLQSLMKSQRDTLLIVVAAIYLMLVILFRSPILALVVLVPQVLPVFVVLGVMGFAQIPLDLVTTMIASIAMGVGIDPAIQYAVRYRAELAATRNAAESIRRCHATIGRAILIANGITFAGFSILAFSNFVPTIYFGLLTGLAMVLGLFASLTLLPSLFVLLKIPR